MALVKCRCGKLFGRSGYVQQPWGRFAEMFLGGIKGAGRSEVELELRGRLAGGVGVEWSGGLWVCGVMRAVLVFDNKEM
jgi:hypothetical protein